MGGMLHEIRNCSSFEEFVQQKEQFEQKFFQTFERGPPRWYVFLYRSFPSLLVACYKQNRVPGRFLFQGTGCSESSNLLYKRLIIGNRIRLRDMPLEIVWFYKRKTTCFSFVVPNNFQLKSTISIGRLNLTLSTVFQLRTVCMFAKVYR